MNKLPIPKQDDKLAKLTPLQLYLREIARYDLLTPEEEHSLAVEQFEHQDVGAAHRLITANLRLVVKIANDFKKAQTNLLDLIQEGNYGLMQAVKKYNPYKGVKLSSYAAWWIRAYILKYLMDNHSQVKIATTSSQRKLFYNLQKETDRLLSEYDAIDPKMVAGNLGVSVKDVIEMQKRLSGPDVSLNAPLNSEGDGSYTREDLLDSGREAIDSILADQQVKLIFSQYLDEFKESLDERDLDLLEKRILNDDPKTLQELGEEYGVSRERARQIEARIIKKLKEFVKEKGVLDL